MVQASGAEFGSAEARYREDWRRGHSPMQQTVNRNLAVPPRHLADYILRQQTGGGHLTSRMDMERSRGGDPGLSEVKAVLQRLQQIPDNPQADTYAQTVPEPASGNRRLGLAVALGLVAVLLVAAGVFVMINPNPLIELTAGRLRQSPTPVPEQLVVATKPAAAVVVGEGSLRPPTDQPAPPPRPALEAAMGLLSTGSVQAARKQLLAISSEDAADVAWALARSYDPNFLETIAGADAQPDIAEASRWYRAWHAAAVKQGLVTHGVSIERIIGSMR